MVVSIRRESARSLFQALEGFLIADEVLGDKQCVRMILEKAEAEQGAAGKKRFDVDRVFRQRLVFGRIDDFLDGWLRRRDIRADPFKVFRYEGTERGPMQHQTAIGPSQAHIDRMHDRLAERVPEFPDLRKAVARASSKAISPTVRLQFPLPLGDADDVRTSA